MSDRGLIDPPHDPPSLLDTSPRLESYSTDTVHVMDGFTADTSRNVNDLSGGSSLRPTRYWHTASTKHS